MSVQNDAEFVREPLIEEPSGDLALLIEADAVEPSDRFATYVRTHPYEAVLLTAAAGLTLGLLIGLRS